MREIGIYKVCKSFRFEAGHQLDSGYTGACVRTPHGHSYVVEVTLACSALNCDGMVIDFGRLKSIFAEVREEYDHALLLSRTRYQQLLEFAKRTGAYPGPDAPKLVDLGCNPTAENIACVITRRLWEGLHRLHKIAPGGFGSLPMLFSVRVHETVTSWAECVCQAAIGQDSFSSALQQVCE